MPATDYGKWEKLAEDDGFLDQQDEAGRGQQQVKSFTLVRQQDGSVRSISYESPYLQSPGTTAALR